MHLETSGNNDKTRICRKETDVSYMKAMEKTIIKRLEKVVVN